MPEKRVTDYDAIAEAFDARYGLYEYAGVRETLLNFLGDKAPLAILEVGCGTGHWLTEIQARLTPSPPLAGVDPSGPMLARARLAAPAARLVRARAEDLPWQDGAFDRIFSVNALHHFADRARFFAEARRLLKPGGGLLTIGKDPHGDWDSWWVYDYFLETREIDRGRYARVRTLRAEMIYAGFAWADSLEADRIEGVLTLAEAKTRGIVASSFTSQLTVLSKDEYTRGMERLEAADVAAGGELQLVSDFRLYATVGWV